MMITPRNLRRCVGVLLIALVARGAAVRADTPAKETAKPHPLLEILESEQKLSMDKLVAQDGTKPYFMQYSVWDMNNVGISATVGSLISDNADHSRYLGVAVRCGDYKIDSTRQIRDSEGFGGRGGVGFTTLPLNDDPVGTRHALWLETDETFKSAARRLAEVKANLKVKVEEEDPSDDFSKEEAAHDIGPWVSQPVDRKAWAEKIKKYSRRFREYPEIFRSSVSLSGDVTNRLMTTSEGSRLQFGRGWWRIGISGSTLADDGMELFQYKAFDAHSPDGLPDDETVMKGVQEVIDDLVALRKAPIVEPYTGPAILMNRASGVFFHEIFGHRIEGHRQKDVEEGQTFAKKLGKEVLPTFLSVVDDPQRRTFGKIELNGYYRYDDECVPAQAAKLIDAGVLKTFLMSRSPTRGIERSNGHGRGMPGASPVSRQGNLTVESTKQVPYPKLREMLIEQVKKQKKDHGFIFKDISGGFTTTQRFQPQAFKVIPIIVYKVYADGRPDELVRGVDIVGTPLTCFSKIIYTGDDADVFNGVCGAESGSVPVAAISPSILVEQIEIEKKQKAQDRPPILDAPIASEKVKKSADAGH